MLECRYTWTDSRLAWDPSKNNNIAELKFNYDQVWTPDVVAYSKKEPTLNFANYKAIVYSSGMVLMVPEEKNKVGVAFDPFDTSKLIFLVF